MATTKKSTTKGATKVGRSAVTGRIVLAPASKGSSISLKDVRSTITKLRASKKK